jgi:NAD-dependent dihydropyrimidine dehydrogenase PreA subunit
VSVQHGIFIRVEVDEEIAGDVALAAKLAEVCPVDIFSAGESGVEIVEENLDECVLCNLCVDAASAAGSADGIKIIKLYD